MSKIYNFTIEQGITFKRPFRWSVLSDPLDVDSERLPTNMTGMTGRMQIRTRDGALLCEPLVVIDDPTNGAGYFALTHEQTQALNFDTAVYDLEIYQVDVPIKRLFKGVVTLDPESTEETEL